MHTVYCACERCAFFDEGSCALVLVQLDDTGACEDRVDVEASPDQRKKLLKTLRDHILDPEIPMD